MIATPKEVLDFWLEDVGPKGWFTADAELDARIRDRFGDTVAEARAGGLDHWRCSPDGCLALLLVLDQFPRNIYRGSPLSFASDARGLAVAKWARTRGFDVRVACPQRQFFYLPLMHSESIPDQDASVRRHVEAPELANSLPHARAHREVIRRFGRFPFRNAALGRTTTPQEQAFLDAGAYLEALRWMDAA